MVRIRLARAGKRNDPFYRIVVIEKRRKNTGKALETIGYWHPREGKKQIKIDLYHKWLAQGAQPTEKVKELIEHEKTS